MASTRNGAAEGVQEVQEQAEQENSERISSPSVKNAATTRTRKMGQRRGLRRFLFENGLTLTALFFFVVSFVGQIASGHRLYNDEQREHGHPPVGLMSYFTTGHFIDAT